MEDAKWAVKYSEADGGTPFAWFITRKDADRFASLMRRQEGLSFEVVEIRGS